MESVKTPLMIIAFGLLGAIIGTVLMQVLNVH